MNEFFSNPHATSGVLNAIVQSKTNISVVTEFLQALGGTLSTAFLLKDKIKGTDTSKVASAVSTQPQTEPRIEVMDSSHAKVNNHIFSLSTLRGVLFSIVSLTILALFTYGGFMTFANRDVVQDYIEQKIKPMIDKLNINQVVDFFVQMSKRIITFVQNTSGAFVDQVKLKLFNIQPKVTDKVLSGMKSSTNRKSASGRKSPADEREPPKQKSFSERKKYN